MPSATDMAAIVYLGKSGSKNFATALNEGVWGCTVDQQWGQQKGWSLKVGDPVLFISFVMGGRRNMATWSARSAQECWLATVSKGWHKNQDNIWGRDPLYEFRFEFAEPKFLGSMRLRNFGQPFCEAARKAYGIENVSSYENGIRVQGNRNVQYLANKAFKEAVKGGPWKAPASASQVNARNFTYGKMYERESRPEQARLKNHLLSTYGYQCALCHQDLERQFLVAAHIKKRSKCSDSEKNDICNIGMLACTLGCDAAYEQGLITVSEKGRIVKNPSRPNPFPSASKAFKVPSGKQVKVWQNSHTHKYFEWHRTKGAGAGQN